MNITINDIEVIHELLEVLGGETVRRVEAETAENKIIAYVIRDNQVRIDIISKRDSRQ